MASLRKDSRGKSPFWYACITVPGKGQTQRCTKIKASERTRAEAMAIAERWECQAKQLGPTVNLKNRAAVLEAFVTATQKAVAGEMNEATAREMLDRILDATGQGVIQTESVRDFSTRWLKARKGELSATSQVAYQHAIRVFLEHLGAMADKPLSAVATKQIETFKASRIGEGLAAKTVDRDLKVVRAVFSAGVKQGQLGFDPTQAVSLTSRQNKGEAQRVTREILKSAELDAILSAATGDWLTATLLGRYIGARLGDCVRMITFSDRSGRRYMLLATYAEEIKVATVATLRDAEKLASALKEAADSQKAADRQDAGHAAEAPTTPSSATADSAADLETQVLKTLRRFTEVGDQRAFLAALIEKLNHRLRQLPS